LRALLPSVGIVAILAATAYGATRHSPVAPSATPRPGAARPAKPRITEHPDKVEISMSAKFAFAGRGARPRFECHLDGGRWRACQAPVKYTGLASGDHVFSTRVVDRRGRRSRPARFRWTLLEPKPFSIVPRLSGLGVLYPGAPPLALPLAVTNPNPAPIFVTGLRVSVTADPAGCASAENLVLGESGASVVTPLEVPAGGSVDLPAPGVAAPTIGLRDLPVNQDACMGARFPLEFSGSARG
jgi:hypothetical protein